MTKILGYSYPLFCGHCGNTVSMEIVAKYSQVEEHESNGLDWEEGPTYEILVCPTCVKPSFRRRYYHSVFEPDEWVVDVLYPNIPSAIEELPLAVNSACVAANKVRAIDSNAYAVLLGRVLDLVCLDRGATGKTLYEKLHQLSDRGEIPGRLVEMADQLRKLRNIGAHADLGSLTPDEVPILEDITRAILEYVYKAPALINKVRDRLNGLKQKTKLTGNST